MSPSNRPDSIQVGQHDEGDHVDIYDPRDLIGASLSGDREPQG